MVAGDKNEKINTLGIKTDHTQLAEKMTLSGADTIQTPVSKAKHIDHVKLETSFQNKVNFYAHISEWVLFMSLGNCV